MLKSMKKSSVGTSGLTKKITKTYKKQKQRNKLTPGNQRKSRYGLEAHYKESQHIK